MGGIKTLLICIFRKHSKLFIDRIYHTAKTDITDNYSFMVTSCALSVPFGLRWLHPGIEDNIYKDQKLYQKVDEGFYSLLSDAVARYNQVIVIIHWGREVEWMASDRFDENNQLIKEISADIIDENSYAQFEPFVFFGDGAEKLVEVWNNKNCVADLSIKSSAKGQVRLAFEKFQSQHFEDVAYWEPFYLKDFIAGVKK